MNYVGTELELFAGATNWKSYLGSALRPYVRGRVLEVGAGIGGNINYLINPAVTEWTALEPDPALASVIGSSSRERVTVVNGTIDALTESSSFETILYIDVLEHIETDRSELQAATRLLAAGGHLVVLAPAHQFLFGPFDKAVGHFRRYNLAGLRDLTPEGYRIEVQRLMDSVGFFASAANRLALSQSHLSAFQVALWDRVMVRVSRVLDGVFAHRIGKSALMIWRAPAAPEIQA